MWSRQEKVGKLVDVVVDMNRGVIMVVVVVFHTGDSQPGIERRAAHGGRSHLLTPEQELAIVDLICANNGIRLCEIQSCIVAHEDVFYGENSIRVSTIDRILKRHNVSMKAIYRVRFERNSERVKGEHPLRHR
ncbi:hypothetical protein EOD39_11930 [Acipenser ruthenus]|uniref:Uncharacterized protein n=1 Tax=Acipenser ruthenus TaxID=7906 RepID=A0A444UML5_ACIRT|nr:hypothetical protein EOD39_11930 [Acipenser ruthenus]